MDLKGLLADQMGHFTPYDVAGAILCMLTAALLAFVFALLVGPRSGVPARSQAVLAAVLAVAVALVRGSVPLSIGLVAVALLVRPAPRKQESGDPRRAFLTQLMAAVIGVGCGASASLVMLALLLPLALLFRWGITIND